MKSKTLYPSKSWVGQGPVYPHLSMLPGPIPTYSIEYRPVTPTLRDIVRETRAQSSAARARMRAAAAVYAAVSAPLITAAAIGLWR